MNFIYPEFLYALALLAIPIIIHLFNFRKYKTVKFSQVRFLKEVKQQTQSTSRLKHLLVLLSRCLAIIALVLAFAQPYFPEGNEPIAQGKKGVSIYIDNSFSMQANGADGPLLSVAKNKALSIVESFEESDKFQLLTNDFEAKQQRWLNKPAFLEALQEVKISPNIRKISEVFSRQNDLKEKELYAFERFIISDFQRSTFDLEKVKDSLKINLIEVKAAVQENFGITQLRFSKPYHLKNQNEVLSFVSKRFGERNKAEISAQLLLDGKLKSPAILEFENTDSVSKTIKYISKVEDEIKGATVIKDFPVSFDDTLYFNYQIQKAVNVIHLYDEVPNKNLSALYATDSSINYQRFSTKQIDFSALSNAELIVLENVSTLTSGLSQELSKYINSGGDLILFPSSTMSVSSFNGFLSSFNIDNYGSFENSKMDILELNEASIVFDDVFDRSIKNINLPTVFNYWKIENSAKTIQENLYILRNGYPFIRQYETNTGKIYLAASGLSPSESSFSQHALFVPTLYNIALLAQKKQKPYFFLTDEKIEISGITASESPVHLINKNIDLIPKQRIQDGKLVLFLGNEVKNAGHYDLFQEDLKVGAISLNYDRSESDLSVYTIEDLKTIGTQNQLNLGFFDGSNETLKLQLSGIVADNYLWKYLIVCALLFLGLETLLLRLKK